MSRILGKFVQDSTITDLQIRLRNNLPLRARNAGDTADISILQIGATDVLEILREMSMENNKITNLADGTAPTDAVNLSQVQALVSGLTDPKDAVKAGTTAALPANTYANGASGVGATLTADANGALPSQDSVALAVSDRLLVKDEVDQTKNGIYVVTDLGSAGTPWILTRAEDANIGGGDATSEPEGQQVTQGMNVPVAEGTDNGGIAFIMTTVDPISLGTSSLNFIRLGENIIAGQGLQKSGSTLSVDAGDGLGFSGNSLVVLVDNDLVTGSTKILPGGEIAGPKAFKETFNLNGTDISNGYIDLAKVVRQDDITFRPRFGIVQTFGVDYTLSYTGGAGGKTRLTWSGDLVGLLVASDIVEVEYGSLDF